MSHILTEAAWWLLVMHINAASWMNLSLLVLTIAATLAWDSRS